MTLAKAAHPGYGMHPIRGCSTRYRQGALMRLIIAYIDPGAGSLVIQAIIATLVAIPFFFRNAIRSTIGRFRRTPQPKDEPGATPPDPE